MAWKYTVLLLAALALLCGCNKKKAALTGETREGDNYTLTVTPPAEGKVGQKAGAVVQVLPGNGFKINLEYPTKLTVSGPTGATPQKLELSAKQATALLEHELKFRPAFTVTSAGTFRFAGKLKFSVCTKKLCHFHDLPVAWESKVAD